MASSWVSRLPLAVLLLVACSSTAAATSYTVGDGSGWTTGVDYTSWAASKNFKVGDNLVFNYAKGLHTVVEVSAAEYMACTAANPLGSDSSGATTVALKTPGTHYFVCSITGHCGAGMKLAVTVGGSNSPATTPTPTTPRTSPTTPTTPYTTPTTPTTTTPYTTPTTPTCSGGGGTTATPGMTPFMSYPSAAGLGSEALAGFALVWCVIVQLALL
ncbi:blue copper protein-like [Miscanthus floridulus]|uniref:blue copper protein-like n=1 Tax=Miscanthus floridulus TaxID=154761 RepID=UPI0034587E70